MIITRLDGGLGNQMFQYAYGLFLAEKHSTQLLLDAASYAARPQHGFLLDRFCTQAQLADSSHQRLIPPRYHLGAKPNHFANFTNWSALRRHKESVFGFKASHLSVPDQRYLVGYWQSEMFFPGLRTSLLERFTPAAPLSPKSQEVADKIRTTNSVVLHVRRGDYLTNPAAAKLYSHLDFSYYLACLHDWAASQAGLEVFVFSNDMAWCRRNVQLPWPTHWVDHNDHDSAHEDMLLMSLAACLVIANSTFSWWAAWLNQRAGATVYAPPHWFQPGTKDGSHIPCTGWRRLSASQQVAA